jgi:hypothetical protein
MRPASVGGTATIARRAHRQTARFASGSIGVKDDSALVALDSSYRRRQAQATLVELLPHQQRDPLRAAVEAVLLGAAVSAQQRVEATAGVGVEEDVEERDVARLGRPDRLGRQLEEAARRRGLGVALDPGGEGLTVPIEGLRRQPRPLQRHAAGHPVEAATRLFEVGEGER